MLFDAWNNAIAPKVQGSWNLYALLPNDLDFFILLSSVLGLTGFGGQASYASGNTYQDSLAAYRMSIGQNAVSLDLGWMQDEGVVVANKMMEKRIERVGCYIPITKAEYYALLDIYCNLNRDAATRATMQRIIGLESPKSMRLKGVDAPPWMTLPLFCHLEVGDAPDRPNLLKKNQALDYRELLETAKILDDVLSIVTAGLVRRMSRLTMTDEASIDTSRSLYDHGLDSLVAIELRNWAAKDVMADIAVFDIMDAGSFQNLSMRIAKKSEYCLKLF